VGILFDCFLIRFQFYNLLVGNPNVYTTSLESINKYNILQYKSHLDVYVYIYKKDGYL